MFASLHAVTYVLRFSTFYVDRNDENKTSGKPTAPTTRPAVAAYSITWSQKHRFYKKN